MLRIDYEDAFSFGVPVTRVPASEGHTQSKGPTLWLARIQYE